MRFLRTILNTLLILGTITVWEVCRKNIIPIVTSWSVEKKDNDSSKVEATLIVKTLEEKEEEKLNQSEEQPKEKEQKEIIPSTVFSFEKGFAEIAKRAMNSVVNVSTMQIIKDESISEGMEGIFRGFPFDDIFRDFFGGMVPNEKGKVRRANTSGSGFVVKIDKATNKAYIVTNNHVVEKAKKIVISISDRIEIPAEIHAYDQRIDIAVLSVNLNDLGEYADKLRPVIWGDSDTLEEGNWVIAIGNPFGLGNTVTSGIVSGKGRTVSISGQSFLSLVDEFIQHSAQINMGNSGGCLLDIKGKVIGINNAIASINGGNIGIGFAIPSNIVKIAVEQLIEHKRTFRGWLGAEVHPVDAKLAESVGIDTSKTKDMSKRFGAFIAKVVPEGPADKAGIKRGDIILEFNGIKISEKGSLQKAVGSSKIDTVVKAKLWRQSENKGWQEVIVDVKVGDFEKAVEIGTIDSSKESTILSKKKEEEIPELGITVSKIPEKMRGVIAEEFLGNLLITKVDETKSSAYFETLFLPGDIIVSVNNIKVTTVEELQKIIKNIKQDKNIRNRPIPFLIVRGGSMVMLAIVIDFDASSSDNNSESAKVTEIPKSEKK